MFGVVFATDTNSIALFFVVNTTNTDSEKILQKLSTDEKAEQSNEPEAEHLAAVTSADTGPGYCCRYPDLAARLAFADFFRAFAAFA